MKTLCYLILASVTLVGCDKAAQSSEKVDKQENTIKIKDVSPDARNSFMSSFKTSCISEAMKQPGVNESMRERLQSACDCVAEKAEEIITIEDAQEIAIGNKKIEERIFGELKKFIPVCFK